MGSKAFFSSPGVRGPFLGLAVAALVWAVARTGALDGREDWALDEAFLWRGRRATSAKVVLIGIDEASLRRLGKNLSYFSPELAEVVAYAESARAAAIGIDVLVPEHMTSHPEIAQPSGKGFAVPMGLAVRKSGKVVLPCYLADEADGTSHSSQWRRSVKQWLLKALDPEEQALTDLGFVDLAEDGDQFVRRQQLLAECGGEPRAHMGYALYSVAANAEVTAEAGTTQIGGVPVPLGPDGRMLVNFVGPPGSFPALPFHEVLRRAKSGEPSPELAGAVVLVGVTARIKQDYHSTPYSNLHARWLPGSPFGKMAGCEYHANVYATLSDRAFIREPGPRAAFAVLALTGLALGYGFTRVGLGGSVLLWLGHYAAWKLLTLEVFSLWHVRLPVSSVQLCSLLLFMWTLGMNWRHLRRLFRLFVSPPVAAAVEGNPSFHESGVEVRTVTVLFADIRDFTSFSERHGPEEVAAMLTAYFDLVVPVVEANHGVLNTYLGDGLLATFGAISKDNDQAIHAVEAAHEMIRRVRGCQELARQMAPESLRVGIGIHTGETGVGSLGSAERLQFTVIGDTPNTAARIEAENKNQGTDILISEATWSALGASAGELGCEPQPRAVRLKGKKEPVAVYPVIVT